MYEEEAPGRAPAPSFQTASGLHEYPESVGVDAP
jgi:hypothetical protein